MYIIVHLYIIGCLVNLNNSIHLEMIPLVDHDSSDMGKICRLSTGNLLIWGTPTPLRLSDHSSAIFHRSGACFHKPYPDRSNSPSGIYHPANIE